MTAIDTTADATVFKTGPFWNRRYTLALFINGKHAGISWNITRKQSKTLPKILADNAAQVLESYGLMDYAYGLAAVGAVPTEAEKPPLVALVKELVTPDGAVTTPPALAPGVRVTLLTDIGHFTKGQVGTITRLDELIPGIAEENQYPVRVALTHGADTVEIPLHLHEIEATR